MILILSIVLLISGCNSKPGSGDDSDDNSHSPGEPLFLAWEQVPAEQSNETSASFSFSSERESTFYCKLHWNKGKHPKPGKGNDEDSDSDSFLFHILFLILGPRF